MKKRIAAFCGMVLLLGLPLNVWGGDDLSKGAVLDTLLQTAPSYTSYISAEDIVSGYNEGEFRSEKLATDVEMLVMISRAFPSMPEPKGNNKMTLPEKADTSEVPEWAAKNFAYLNSRGIITSDTVLDDSVTEDELKMYLKRVWRYYGSDLKDDFYFTVNSDKLSAAKPGFDFYTGSFADANTAASEQVKQIISDIVKKGANTAKEQKIKSIYLSAIDLQRNKGSIDPLKPYLNKVDSAKNTKELQQAMEYCDRELFNNGLILFGINVDIKNTDRYLPVLSVYEPTFSYDEFSSEKYQKAFTEYVTSLFVISGESRTAAAEKAEKICRFEKELSRHCLSRTDAEDMELTYNLVTFAELQKMYSFLDLKELAANQGFDLSPDDAVLVPDTGLAYNMAACGEDLELTKDLIKVSLLALYGDKVSYECIKANEKFEGAIYGSGSASLLTIQERSVNMTKDLMEDYLSELYAEKYVTEKDIENVREITDSIINNYKKMITEIDWMSDATKKKALKKLDKMGVKIGYGSGQTDILANADIRYDNTYFRNYLTIQKAYSDWMTDAINKPVDRSMWSLPAYEVNACYISVSNEIILPAAILRAPFYSASASYEENLGGLGTVIAHEVSHAFDNHGALFDEKGDYVNWWTEEDYKRFSEKCSRIAAYYDGEELASGIANNGRFTVGEAIADLGALKCTADVLKQHPNADMAKYYTEYAKIWECVTTREYIEYLSMNDEHPFSNIRVNLSLSNMPDFLEVFDINEGDGMYLAENERVGLW